MKKVAFIVFLLGASGMAILAVSAWKERRKEHYDKAGINSRRYFRNVSDIKKFGVQNNKTA